MKNLSYDSPNEYGGFPPGLYSTGKAKGAARLRYPFCYPPVIRRIYFMLAQTRIDEMKNIDIRTVDKNALPDMSGFKFDNTLSRTERARRILEASKNPYLFRLDDMIVKIEFADHGKPLQEHMGALMLRHKCGL